MFSFLVVMQITAISFFTQQTVDSDKAHLRY
jgi:hypothetical protein